MQSDNNFAAIGVATWRVVIASDNVHYNRGLKDALRQAERKQDGTMAACEFHLLRDSP